MKKLLLTLTSKRKDLTLERAGRVVNGLERAQQQIIFGLEGEIDTITNKIENLLDLGPTHTTQLKMEQVEDSNKLMTEVHELRVKLAIKEQDLKIAKKTLEEVFEEVEKPVYKVKGDTTKGE